MGIHSKSNELAVIAFLVIALGFVLLAASEANRPFGIL